MYSLGQLILNLTYPNYFRYTTAQTVMQGYRSRLEQIPKQKLGVVSTLLVLEPENRATVDRFGFELFGILLLNFLLQFSER
jgi:hypothetical protein